MEQQWYKIYPKLPSAMFTEGNSAAMNHMTPPYKQVYNSDDFISGIEGVYGLDEVWKVVGYTEQPPFGPATDVAIMFENQYDFEKIWWHFTKE